MTLALPEAMDGATSGSSGFVNGFTGAKFDGED